MAAAIDAHFVENVIARIAALPEDVVPQWGRMTKRDLVRHLFAVLSFTLGEYRSDIPYQTGPWMRRWLKFLVLGLNVPMRRHIVFRDKRGEILPLPVREGTIEELTRALEQTRDMELACRPHPYFGDLRSEEWKRLHVKHIAHHLRQFGAPL
jgi:hypothetical protein